MMLKYRKLKLLWIFTCTIIVLLFHSAYAELRNTFVESKPQITHPKLIALNRPSELDPKSCVFPDGSGKSAPPWICNERVEGLFWTTVGSARKSMADKEILKQMASSTARAQLTVRFKVYILDRIKSYLEKTGNEERFVMFLGSMNRTIDDKTMKKVKVYKESTSPTGSMFILAGITKTDLIETTVDVLKRDMKSNEFIWAQVSENQKRESLIEKIAGIK